MGTTGKRGKARRSRGRGSGNARKKTTLREREAARKVAAWSSQDLERRMAAKDIVGRDLLMRKLKTVCENLANLNFLNGAPGEDRSKRPEVIRSGSTGEATELSRGRKRYIAGQGRPPGAGGR